MEDRLRLFVSSTTVPLHELESDLASLDGWAEESLETLPLQRSTAVATGVPIVVFGTVAVRGVVAMVLAFLERDRTRVELTQDDAGQSFVFEGRGNDFESVAAAVSQFGLDSDSHGRSSVLRVSVESQEPEVE